jgi:hypothetical protein
MPSEFAIRQPIDPCEGDLIGVICGFPKCPGEIMRTFFLVIGAWAMCGTTAVGQVTAYSNNTTNEGFQLHFSATTVNGNTSTQLYADDITVAPSSVGMVVSQFQFGIRNQNPPSDPVTVRPRVRFYLPDGTSGMPGTLIQAYDLPLVSVNSNSLGIVNFTPPVGFTIPAAGTSGTNFWAGVFLDNNNGSTGTTQFQFQNLSQQYFDPPTVGSSHDSIFAASTFGDFNSNNPPGSLLSFQPMFVSNFLWQFTATPVPEPTSLALFGIASAVAVSWRRMRKVNRTDRA